MKKILYVLLAALIVLSLAGCKGKSNTIELSRGSWDADKKVFTNDVTGIKITLTDGYIAATDDELVDAYLDDSSIDLTTADYTKMNNIPDCAFYKLTGENCGVLYENIAAEGEPNISEDDYLDVAIKKLDGSTSNEYYDVTISGNKYRAYDRKIEEAGVTYYQTFAVKNVGGYMAIIVCTAYAPEDNQTMIDLFN